LSGRNTINPGVGYEGITDDHVVESLQLLEKMNNLPKAGDEIAKNFSKCMFHTMTEKIDDKEIQIASNHLCRSLLKDLDHVDNLYFAGGVPA